MAVRTRGCAISSAPWFTHEPVAALPVGAPADDDCAPPPGGDAAPIGCERESGRVRKALALTAPPVAQPFRAARGAPGRREACAARQRECVPGLSGWSAEREVVGRERAEGVGSGTDQRRRCLDADRMRRAGDFRGAAVVVAPVVVVVGVLVVVVVVVVDDDVGVLIALE